MSWESAFRKFCQAIFAFIAAIPPPKPGYHYYMLCDRFATLCRVVVPDEVRIVPPPLYSSVDLPYTLQCFVSTLGVQSKNYILTGQQDVDAAVADLRRMASDARGKLVCQRDAAAYEVALRYDRNPLVPQREDDARLLNEAMDREFPLSLLTTGRRKAQQREAG